MSTPAAAIPATTNSQNASCVRTISCPCALNVNITTELTTRATAAITIAPRAALILGEPSFKQMVHVAADTPESIAKRIADVGTFTSLFWVMEAVAVTAAHSPRPDARKYIRLHRAKHACGVGQVPPVLLQVRGAGVFEVCAAIRSWASLPGRM